MYRLFDSFQFPSDTVLVLVVLVLVAIILKKGLIVVHQAEAVVIERLGKYNRTLQPGINFIIPIFDQPKVFHWVRSADADGQGYLEQRFVRLDLREQVFDFPKQVVITADNVLIQINALLYYQINDPKACAYEIANLPQAIEKLTQTTLRNVVGEMSLDETLVSRNTINAKLREILD